MYAHRTHQRDQHAPLVDGLAEWDRGTAAVSGLHSGDLGWALREPDAPPVHAWWSAEGLAAVVLAEGPVARTRIAPGLTDDPMLAEVVAGVVGELDGSEVWADVAPATALADRLRRSGWVDDGDPWVTLHLDLSAGFPVSHDRPDLARGCVAERVAVQRGGFERSTFTAEKWALMAAGPGYLPDLDVVVRTSDGQAAAAATAWLSIPGGTAILEPVATHCDHRGQGHGRRVILAAAEAARRAGATGISVSTPASNAAAVAAYTSAGFRCMSSIEALTLSRVEP